MYVIELMQVNSKGGREGGQILTVFDQSDWRVAKILTAFDKSDSKKGDSGVAVETWAKLGQNLDTETSSQIRPV